MFSSFPRTSAAVPAWRRFEPIWFEWLNLLGLFAFCAWLLGVKGVWQLLFRSDPTGITLVIVVVFVVATLWCGVRARVLGQQRQWLEEAVQIGAATSASPSWAADYWHAVRHPGQDTQAALDVLLERTHGIHSTAWWVNGVQLKLGLLGKVIGFSILAMQIGQIQNFDPAQSQELLRNLTTGLGVALLTTMVGLVGNILLGLQLTRLDRFADELVTRAQQHALTLRAV